MDKNQLEPLLRQHHQAAFFWALQLCRYQDDSAREVLQMTYLKILENKARYNQQSSFKTWLFSVIRFTAFDFLKNQRHHGSLEHLEIADDTPALETELDLVPFLKKLPERQQQVLLLAFYHDLSLSAIAEVLDLHVGSVRTHYQRGKDGLRTLLKPIRS
ncbi:MAG: sigma-70 family RNA polymerase sigma factor [Bacteroidota bacterium]